MKMLSLYVLRCVQLWRVNSQLVTRCHRAGAGRLSFIRCLRTGSPDASWKDNMQVLKSTKWTLLYKEGTNKVPQGSVWSSCQHFCLTAARSSAGGELIYTGNLGRAVLGVKFFSYSSSMFSICVTPYLFLKTGLGLQSFALQVAFFSVLGFFTFLTPVLLHLFTKGYVVRLYHDKGTDMYTAVTYSALLVEKTTVFHQSDVKVPDVSKMFTTFYAKGKSMLVNPMLFPLPHNYNHLMGYDQPFTFDVDEIKKQDGS
ncbi:transmembrane protein 70, mitochondrial [Arapaima gigas]